MGKATAQAAITYAIGPDPNFPLPKRPQTDDKMDGAVRDVLYILKEYSKRDKECYVAGCLIEKYIKQVVGSWIGDQELEKSVSTVLDWLVDRKKVEKTEVVAPGPMVTFSVYRLKTRRK